MATKSDGPAARRANRLASEQSPYLLQHAHNPVDWWPWGEGAFAEARRRRVPIFLSVGYSTCYWCHVMERESFESDAIAAVMNERFVCVKVDREQRPDVDELYMAATQIMTGHGGWPMSVFLEPDRLRPFWCGTYFPAEAHPGLGSMPTFPRVLEGIAAAWADQPDEVLRQAESLAAAVREHLGAAREPVPVGVGTVQSAASTLLRMFDRTHGGFGGAPKFPQPVYLDLLLDIRERAADEATRTAIDQALRHTLDRMACGGVRDHVGGGFHRYSVDAAWTVPHFEKMLYDNAMLAEVYARAGAAFDRDTYRDTARQTVAFVLREMVVRDAGGLPIGFATAQDAEVRGREGLNYLWTPEQVRRALPEEDAAIACAVYGLDRGPNFRDPHHPDEPPSNVLRLDGTPDQIADRFGLDAAAMATRLDRINAALLAARAGRERPATDDKVVLSWNALMVRALAIVASCEPEFPGGRSDRQLSFAVSVAGSLLSSMRSAGGDLLRIARQGTAQTPAVLEDYAAMVHALVVLRRVLGIASRADTAVAAERGAEAAWADAEARRLIAEADRLFGDGAGGFFDTRQDATDLFVRARSTYDGAMPAGSTLMALALAELAVQTGLQDDAARAIAAVRSISGALAENAAGTAVGARALLILLGLRAPEVERLGSDDHDRIGSTGPAQAEGHGGPFAADPDFTPVEVYAPDERLSVTADRPGELRLLVRIAPGFHIIAADPGESEVAGAMSPFRIDVEPADGAPPGSTRGIAAFADYPPGRSLRPSALAEHVLVYEGEFEVRVIVERLAGPAPARPILVVSFQACTDAACLRPRRLELDVAIDAD